MEVGHGGPAGADHGVGGPTGHHDHAEVGRPVPEGGLGPPAFDVKSVGGEGVDQRGDLRLAGEAPYPQGVVEPAALRALHGGGPPDPAPAGRLDGHDTGGRGPVGRLQEHPRHAVRGHEGPYVVPAAYGGVAAGGRRPRNGDPGAGEDLVAEPLVEEDGQLAGVVEAQAAGQRPDGRREGGVPAGPALHPGGLPGAAQEPVDLGVLPRRLDPYDLVGGEGGAAPAQDVRPGHDARRGQPGVAHRPGEQGDAPVLRVADDRPARRWCVVRHGPRATRRRRRSARPGRRPRPLRRGRGSGRG